MEPGVSSFHWLEFLSFFRIEVQSPKYILAVEPAEPKVLKRILKFNHFQYPVKLHLESELDERNMHSFLQLFGVQRNYRAPIGGVSVCLSIMFDC